MDRARISPIVGIVEDEHLESSLSDALVIASGSRIVQITRMRPPQ